MKLFIRNIFILIVFLICTNTVYGTNKDSVYVTNSTKIFVVKGTSTNILDNIVEISSQKKSQKKSELKKSISTKKTVKKEIVKKLPKVVKPSFKQFISKNNSSDSISISKSRNTLAIETNYQYKNKFIAFSSFFISKNIFIILENERIETFYLAKFITKGTANYIFSRPPPQKV